jgi:DNA-binding SARP family transcriptional activator
VLGVVGDAGSAAARRLRLELLGGFRMFGSAVRLDMPDGAARLLAFLALHTGKARRSVVAARLFPEASEPRAQACLRSALRRLDRPAREALELTPLELGLAGCVSVDLRDARSLANDLLRRGEPAEPDPPEAIEVLSHDVLPGWTDDWVVAESEDWLQLRLHALEALAADLTARSRFGPAASAALAAVRVDPLRESATAALIRVHLAEGNQSEALRAFARYRRQLSAELGLSPTPQLTDLVEHLLGAERAVVTPLYRESHTRVTEP